MISRKFSKTKSFIVVFIIMCTASVSFGAWMLYNQYHETRRSYDEINDLVAENLSSHIDTAIDVSNIIAGNLAIDTYTNSYMLSPNTFSLFPDITEKIESKINSFINLNNYISSIYIYSPTKKTICSGTGYEFREWNFDSFTDKEAFPEFTDGVSSVIFDRISQATNRNTITICRHITDTVNSGYVVVNIDTAKLFSTYSTTDVNGYYAIIDNNRTIYMHNIQNINISDDELKNGFSKIGTHVYRVTNTISTNYKWTYTVGTLCDNYKQNMLSGMISTFIVIIFMLIISFIAAYVISDRMSAPIRRLTKLFAGTAYDINPTQTDDVQVVAENILKLINSNTQLKAELENKISQLNDTQLANLQSQINPHFLYNSLNIINWTILREAGADSESLKMISDLANLLAYTTNISETYVSLNDELYYTELYINLLKKRYKDSFNVIMEIPKELKSIKIAKLSLQPLIENSVYHGFKQNSDNKTIKITAEQNDELVTVSVIDNGSGIDKEQLDKIQIDTETIPKEHIGLANVKKRLKLLFGEDSEFIIESEKNKGTTVSLRYKAKG